MGGRKCSACQLCCWLVPVDSLKKAAATRCEHQRTGQGCSIYEQRPNCCRVWTCRWLAYADTPGMRRPDKCHYVIDAILDFVGMTQGDSVRVDLPAIQIWVDPNFPNAHRDAALRSYLARQAIKNGAVGLVRMGGQGIVLVPPSMSEDGEWFEVGGIAEREHSIEEIARAIGAKVMIE